MIKDLLDLQKVDFDVEAKDWEDALRKAAGYLVETGKISGAYVENMIQAVHEKGPYIVIMPGVAFGHARPDESVFESCLHMIRLKHPVEFGSKYNDPVKVVFVFASKEEKGHLGVMRGIAKMLVDEDNVGILLNEEDKDRVLELLGRY